MVKDRTEEFKGKSKEYSKVPQLEMNSKKSSKMDGGIQNFLHDVEGIESELNTLRQKVDNLMSIQKDIFASPQGYKNVKEYDKLVKVIHSDSAKIRKDLKQIEGQILDKPKDDESALNKIRTQQVNRLTTYLSNITNDFYVSQSAYMDRMKENLRKQLAVTGHGKDNSELNEILDSDTQYAAFTQNFQTECNIAEHELRIIEERDKDIKELEKNISKVNSLFIDMNVLISEQGETLTHIEKQVSSAQDVVECSKVKIEDAIKSKKRRRRRCCCFAVIGLVAGLIVLAIILGIILG